MNDGKGRVDEGNDNAIAFDTAGLKWLHLWGVVMRNDKEEVIIRPWSEGDSIEELTEFLHRAYKVLADMQLRFHATFQDVEVTRERIAGASCFIAEHQGKIIGTITYYGPSHTKGTPFLDLPGTAHMGQLGVEPEMRGRKIGTQLDSACRELSQRPMELMNWPLTRPNRPVI